MTHNASTRGFDPIQTIGVIGSGNIGSGVTRLALATGKQVLLANSRGPESLQATIAELGQGVTATHAARAAAEADVVVVAIPFNAYNTLPVQALAGKTVIDAMNYYPARDGMVTHVASGAVPSSELLQSFLSDSEVVKAFNNIDYVRLVTMARSKSAIDRSGLPIAGDHEASKARVAGFIDEIGYDTFDLGPLSESWRSQPDTPVYVQPYLGARPSNLVTVEQRATWFSSVRGIPVPVAEVRQLAARAQRRSRV